MPGLMTFPRISRNARAILTAPMRVPSGTSAHDAVAPASGTPADHQKSSAAPSTDARTPPAFNCLASAASISDGTGSECGVAVIAAAERTKEEGRRKKKKARRRKEENPSFLLLP